MPKKLQSFAVSFAIVVLVVALNLWHYWFISNADVMYDVSIGTSGRDHLMALSMMYGAIAFFVTMGTSDWYREQSRNAVHILLWIVVLTVLIGSQLLVSLLLISGSAAPYLVWTMPSGSFFIIGLITLMFMYDLPQRRSV